MKAEITINALKGTLSPIFRGNLKTKKTIPIRGNPKILVQFRLKLLYQFSETKLSAFGSGSLG